MTIVEMIYDAKCKHCANIKPYYQGKRKYHRCKVHDRRVTLIDKGCRDFKL